MKICLKKSGTAFRQLGIFSFNLTHNLVGKNKKRMRKKTGASQSSINYER